jgi:DNA-binding Lrp family transcriptional regulator
MSYTQEITNELINYEGLKANTKILLLVLMTHRNREKGYAYPSQSTLIKKTGLSKNTLLKCLDELEKEGYIKRFKEKGENNKYYIDINFINSKVGTSIKIDTSSSIKINTSEDITSIKNDTGGSIKINTLKVRDISNKKEKENKKSNIDKIIEAYTKNDLLVEAIRDFIKMRSTIKKPLTDRALKGILNKLDNFTNNDLDKIEILENSIMNCWQGVFELKNKKVPTRVDTKNNNLVNPSICNNDKNYSSRGREIL